MVVARPPALFHFVSCTAYACALGACADPKGTTPDDPVPRSSGQTAVASTGDAVYIPLVDDGDIARVSIHTGKVTRTAVGAEPTRVAVLDDRVLVTLRNERAIAVLTDVDNVLRPIDRVSTGTEPSGIAVHPDGTRFYVVLSTQEEVHEIDAENYEVIRSIPITGQPEWLAVHPGGDTLYIGTVVRGAFAVDLRQSDPTPIPIDLPAMEGAGTVLTRTVTGDLAVSPDGTRLAIPALWQDILRPPRHTDDESMERDPAERYAEIGLGLSPNNPAIVVVDLDADGLPTDSMVSLYGVGEAKTLLDEEPRVVRGYFAAATWAPDGSAVLGAMEGSRVIVAMGTEPSSHIAGPADFTQAPSVFVGTGQLGVNGLAFVEGDQKLQLFASHWIDRSAVEIDWEAIAAGLAAQVAGAPPEPLFSSATPIPLGPPTLDPQVEEGRDLFHNAVSGVMSTPASGLSCSTCHVNGRTSGVNVMERDGVARQVPSFAGAVAITAPFTWNNEIPTVPEEARITSQIRLGGRGATDAQFEAVAAYIEYIRDVDHPEKGSNSEQVQRGRDLFLRPDIGCARCHAGVRLTDNNAYDLFGLTNVNTPTLVGVVATAPYLHDGRAATLRDVLLTGRDRQMGNTADLTDAELDDLEAYLRSL